jgi:hypothetical protein
VSFAALHLGEAKRGLGPDEHPTASKPAGSRSQCFSIRIDHLQPVALISEVLFICLFLHFYVARAFSSYAELHVRTWSSALINMLVLIIEALIFP